MNKRKVLLADQHPIVLECLAARINGEEDFTVCALAKIAAEAIKALTETQPDVILLGLAFKDRHGLELIRDIRSRTSKVPILVFTMFDEATYAIRALRAGAQGYLTKRETSERVVHGLRAVLNGELVINEEVSRHSAIFSLLQPSSGSQFESLADRELEVFELIGKGLGTREIAARLGCSVKTIETYRARIKEKLYLDSAAALTREAVRWVESAHQTKIAASDSQHICGLAPDTSPRRT